MLKNKNNPIILGFYIFSLYFGAGNLIFPSYMGFKLGSNWLAGFIGFFISEILLTVLALISFVRKKNYEEFSKPLGQPFADIFLFVLLSLLTPIICLPRIGATVFEFAIKPYLAEIYANNNFIYLIYLVFYFTLVMLFANYKNSINLIGRILAPMLILCITFLLVKGFLIARNSFPNSEGTAVNPFLYGFKTGYQIMSSIMAVPMGILLLQRLKVNKNKQDLVIKTLTQASFISGLLLLLIYSGLIYLGVKFNPLNTNSENLSTIAYLSYLLNFVLGTGFGKYLISTIMILACFTTAVGLSLIYADFLKTKFKIKPINSYKIIMLSSSSLAFLKVEGIIQAALPILELIYPIYILLVFYNLFKLKNHKLFKLACCITCLSSVLNNIYY